MDSRRIFVRVAGAVLAALLSAAGPPGARAEPPPAEVPPFLEINRITPAQYAGAVSFAMESMRLVYGEMSPEAERKFAAKWRPLFEHCTPEVIDWFNKLNPLLGQFLKIRAAMSAAAAAFDEAQTEAAAATTMESPEALTRAMESAELARRQLETLRRAMEQVVGRIVELGDPPDAEAAGKRARKRHDDVLAAKRSEGSGLRLSWTEPPGGWSEEGYKPSGKEFAALGYLHPETDSQRHLVLAPHKSACLTFTAHDDPGLAKVSFYLDAGRYPDPGDFKEEAEGFKEFGGEWLPPKEFNVERTHRFGLPAVHVEADWRAPPDSGGRSASSRVWCIRREWDYVDLGVDDAASGGKVWLVVQIDLQVTGQISCRSPRPGESKDDHDRMVDERAVRLWDAYQAMWRPEIDLIRDRLRIEPSEGPTDQEWRRFTDPDPAAPIRKGFGRPQTAHGAYHFDRAERIDNGERSVVASPEMGATCVVNFPRGYGELLPRSFPVRSAHTYTVPPAVLSPGEAVDVDVTACIETGPELQVLMGKEALLPRLAAVPRMTAFGRTVEAESKTEEHQGPRMDRKTLRFDVPPPESSSSGAGFTAACGLNRDAVVDSASDEKETQFYYYWVWSPKRESGAGEAGGGSSVVGAAPDIEPAPSPEEAAAAKAERQAKLDQIAFCENEIKYRREGLDRLKQDLASAKPGQREALERQILWAEDWIQRAQDQIATLQTGVYTRTRTRADEFNLSVMAAESRKLAEKWDTIHGLVERGPRLIALAPPEEQEKLREFFEKQTGPGSLASGDAEKFKKVVGILGNRVMGSLEGAQARAEIRLIDAEERLQRAENLKAVCETELMILSMGGGTYAYGYTAYQGVTGYVDEGIGEAAKRVLKTYNKATEVACDAMDAWHKGVLDAYERHAKDPVKNPVNEIRAGLGAAGWVVGKAAAMELGRKFVLEPLGRRILGIPDPPRKKTLQELSQEMQYLKRRAEGMDTVKLFQNKLADVAKAAKAGATPEAVDKLQAEAEQVYKLIKTDWFAKMHLNELGRKGGAHLELLRRYNAYDHFAMKQVKERFEARQAGSGFSKQEYRLFSNSASAGKAGIDVDLGVVEPPRFILDAAGNRIANPARRAWLDNLTTERIGGNPGLHEFREQSQKNLEAAFKDVFGYDPTKSAGKEAFVNFTTSDHPEAYRDLAWLGKKGMKTADLENLDPQWAQQAADVSGYKVNSLPEHHPQFGYYATLQEQCRGLAKDYATKLEPMLGRAGNEEARKHLRALNEVMEKFAKNEIGPFEANQRIMQLTGGKGICEAAEQFRTMMQGLAGMK